MSKTEIPYAEYSWNPICGCPLPLCSVGCQFCWARQLHNQRHRAYLAGKKLPKMYAKPFEEIQFFPERLEQPLHWKKPRTIFVGSQTDLFHKDVTNNMFMRMWRIIEQTPQHTYLMLTKRPALMSNRLFNWCFGNGPVGYLPNLYLGVTVCNQAEADEKIPILLQIPAAKRWISIEPCLGEIDLDKNISKYCLIKPSAFVDWVVVGAESGSKARLCKLEHIESIVRQCTAAGVKVFVKQVLLPKTIVLTEYLSSRELDKLSILYGAHGFRLSHDPTEWPEILRRRENL